MFGTAWLSRLQLRSAPSLRLPFNPGRLRVLLPRMRLARLIASVLNREWLLTIIGALTLALWLYYELCYVALVCPYYTGSELPSLLDKFRTIGKTYRPTFYMFAPYCQWMYLSCFCKITRRYRILLDTAAEASSLSISFCAKVGSALLRAVLRCFLFRRIYRDQAEVTVREFVEAHNGAVVVLDYYLPRWATNFCSSCGKFKQQSCWWAGSSRTKAATAGSAYPQTTDEAESSRRVVNTQLEAPNLHEIRAHEGAHQDDVRRAEVARDVPLQVSKDVLKSPNLDGSARSSDRDEPLDDFSLSGKPVPPSDARNAEDVVGPPRKLLRGVIAVIGDVSMSYSVCNQALNCNCGQPVTSEEETEQFACTGCETSGLEDSKGLNLDPPGLPVVRCLISDALEIGFACVQIHLNVNLGMASEAFPTWTGLRCFPVSLYSDALLDLNSGLKRISERYPSLPLCCVGVGFGSNILMEYMSLGSAGKAVPVVFDPSQDPQKLLINMADRRYTMMRRGQSTDQYDSNESRSDSDTESRVSRKSIERRMAQPVAKAPVEVDQDAPEQDSGVSSSARLPHTADSLASDPRRMSEPVKAVAGHVFSPPAHSMTQDMQQILQNPDDPNYESFAYLSQVIGKINASNSATPRPVPSAASANSAVVTPREGHFGFDEEAEECTYETSVAYPPAQEREVVFDTKRISAAVCVNLNLRTSGNALYKSTRQRQIHNQSMYIRHCFAAFKHHLIALVREVHCHRANGSLQKECYLYRCCHYTRAVARQPWSRRVLLGLRQPIEGFHTVARHYRIEHLLLAAHREYRMSYRHMRRRESGEYVNYRAGIFKRFGARAAMDFKLCALMTLRYVYSHTGHDNRGRVETLSGNPTYKLVNKRIDTNLRIGRAHFYGGINKLINQGSRRPQDPKVHKYIAELINREYTRNVANIRRYFTAITLPTLLISSLDNSMFSWEDVDIFDVLKNPNLVYYICKSGGYATFLSGFFPNTWLSRPVLEFLDEMSSRRVLI
ncbi:membrane protein, putative [Babesia bigemina]|uniref:Membrane protein, putative n=1 Tax=Babesia bigemina TaxID=5866 RepID=A0A061DBP7_BABBI|nr:membrane protein, putative [Babesia bigemina]CDR97372.1 membrane protein, putative [Babesia bigemina]|eukprot:XP_012769558.1 membrane protein, putative [Babesia bigemina]